MLISNIHRIERGENVEHGCQSFMMRGKGGRCGALTTRGEKKASADVPASACAYVISVTGRTFIMEQLEMRGGM